MYISTLKGININKTKSENNFASRPTKEISILPKKQIMIIDIKPNKIGFQISFSASLNEINKSYFNEADKMQVCIMALIKLANANP